MAGQNRGYGCGQCGALETGLDVDHRAVHIPGDVSVVARPLQLHPQNGWEKKCTSLNVPFQN